MSKPTPQQTEDAIFRLKNRLIYRRFIVLAPALVVLNSGVWWLAELAGVGHTDWYYLLMGLGMGVVVPMAVMCRWLEPRLELLKYPEWTAVWDRAWYAWQAFLSQFWPVTAPSMILFWHWEGRPGEHLPWWAAGVFVSSLVAFLAFIHTYPFDPEKLRNFALEKGVDISEIEPMEE